MTTFALIPLEKFLILFTCLEVGFGIVIIVLILIKNFLNADIVGDVVGISFQYTGSNRAIVAVKWCGNLCLRSRFVFINN